jgi:hypothetical protein
LNALKSSYHLQNRGKQVPGMQRGVEDTHVVARNKSAQWAELRLSRGRCTGSGPASLLPYCPCGRTHWHCMATAACNCAALTTE